eukprot:CAMPEP_0201543892 /NCGR_PEP_ID=MMETSP0161_2-20130828/72863_1 /ASSEMBLY_ACC=CAM_ASM_000251 /TAXON_ID=180227 /ORGANISM="Neoparamoeba aestuarina, Strain SoJaBio B1-5/56/2" /LENGTH=118 /DNA_ID=CAMNT_0047951747 /DNA_START=447 /DNA_END=800 /DNA_ORIENTATION=-
MNDPSFPFSFTKLHPSTGAVGMGSGIGFTIKGKECVFSALHQLHMLLPQIDELPGLVSLFGKAKGLIYIVEYQGIEERLEEVVDELRTILKKNSGSPLLVLLDLKTKTKNKKEEEEEE